MTHIVGIIGIGHVGAAVAEALVLRKSASKLILIDKNDAKAQAEVYDLADQNTFLTPGTQVRQIQYDSDWQELSECDVLVMAAGNISLLGGENADRLAELNNSIKIVKEVAPKIKQSGFNGILINITNPCDMVVTYLQQQTGIERNRIFGTGTLLYTARMRHAVARVLGCSQQDVSGYVLGEHGESQFCAWSTVQINGVLVESMAAAKGMNLDQLNEEAKAGAWRIVAGKGYTCYGIGLTATTLVEAVLNNSSQAFPLSAYSDQFDAYVGQVVHVGKDGLLGYVSLPLQAEEEAAFVDSAEKIHRHVSNIAQLK